MKLSNPARTHDGCPTVGSIKGEAAMKTTLSGRVQHTIHGLLRVLLLTSVLSVAAACTAPGQPPTSEQDWRTHIVQVPLPKTGCFTATYPSLQWREVACVTAPHVPEAPAQAHGELNPATVGGASGDFIASVGSKNLINSATGEFPTVTGVKSETNSIGGGANVYTLQLNTDTFPTNTSVDSICPAAYTTAKPCYGFQQFIYNGYSGSVGMEYFLFLPGAVSCPPTVSPITPWQAVPATISGYTACTAFSPDTPFGAQPITNLQCLSLTGKATGGGNDWPIIVVGGATGCPTGTASGSAQPDSELDLAKGWQEAEFNVFGAGGGAQAVFNSGSTITVQTTVHYGATGAPICVNRSLTAETNNLTLVGAPSVTLLPSPSIEFTESNKLTGTPACAMATGVGDTHLRTFGGLFYDFQATGDFLLAQTQDFTVQTRQVSGAPTWPNAAVNQAVATQMGHTRVALCAAAPAPLVVDGRPADLADGQTLSLPSGVDVVRTGNVYLVTDHSGNSLRATMNGTWIDASVGLGTWPTTVRGLLANGNGNVNQLEASDGTVYNAPLSFADLYGHYGESWRVAPADSLLADCGGPAPENAVPSQPFFASDLAPNLSTPAQAICTDLGVKVPALLDACTLDVAVLGTEKAAAVYVGAPAPAAVGEGGQANPTPGQG